MAKACAIGIDLRSLVGGDDLGWATRIPCLVVDSIKPNGPIVSCSKYQEETEEEIAAKEREIEALLERHRKAEEVVRAFRVKYKNKSGQETVKCPVCEGKLHLSIAAYNGHVWGKCETKDCLAWME